MYYALIFSEVLFSGNEGVEPTYSSSFLNLVVSLVNVTIILILPHDYVHIISPFERVLHSILASHAILHIRKAAAQNVIQGKSGWDSGIGTGELNSTYPSMSFALNASQTMDEERPRATGSRNV
ncbi:hypothetical protein PM082_024740 [Marasmius tenuissimus]|nr:hypothetical protein PM082_024740 [Marasmius tenuissimus]